jgi:hypothetical protein
VPQRKIGNRANKHFHLEKYFECKLGPLETYKTIYLVRSDYDKSHGLYFTFASSLAEWINILKSLVFIQWKLSTPAVISSETGK